jgi:MFS superfamily sulfate permease-like transporter
VNLINFMSHPVMSGFTTGAALIIGLTQLKAAVGFSLSPPQAGGDVEYNYEVMEWWAENWNYVDDNGHKGRNHYAVAVSTFLISLALF